VPSIPLGKASYKRADLPETRLVNYYYEEAPTSLEDQVALIARPRLKPFTAAGAGPMRGLYRKGGVLVNPGNSGRIIALSAGTLYNVNQNTGVAVSIGAVTGSGFRMSAEGNDDALLLTIGRDLFSTDGATISGVTMPDGRYAWAVDTLNSYFLVASDLGRFYWSAVGGTTFDALDYATAESQPDDLMTLKVVGDELWLLGRLSVEVWQPTGDLNLPFQRITGRIFGIGITARDTAVKMNVGGVDTLLWLGTDRRVYRTHPNPMRISDTSLEERLAKATVSYVGTAAPTADSTLNPYATGFSWNGHDFYVLHLPGQGSFVYDLSTGLWDEITSYGRPLFRGHVSAIGSNALPLLGDDTSNVIWQMTTDQATDGTDPVVFEFTGLLEVPSAPVRCNNVSLTVATGTTGDPDSDPMMQLAMSEDHGRTFEDVGAQPLGRVGERNARLLWTRLGQLRRPGRIFRWRTTEPTTVRMANYNESVR
jgi:hypothetical protein